MMPVLVGQMWITGHIKVRRVDADGGLNEKLADVRLFQPNYRFTPNPSGQWIWERCHAATRASNRVV